MNLTASEQILLAAAALAQRAGRAPDAVQPLAEILSMCDFYFGMYRLDWTDAPAGLHARGLAVLDGETLALTGQGAALAGLLSAAHPRSLYAYNEFYHRARRSPAHARFCEQVYGRDLCQHGMLDMAQLDELEALLRQSGARDVLELGCGNGAVAAYLSLACEAHVTGVELASEGIAWAQDFAAQMPGRLVFLTGDMQQVAFDPASFDAVLLIDAVYFARDLPSFLRQVFTWLRPAGHAYIHYSVWSADPEQQATLAPDATPLARTLQSLDAAYAIYDYSSCEAAHWKRKLLVLEELRPQFDAEGSQWVWQRRWGEANAHQEYVACDGVRRYLYVAAQPGSEG